MTEPTVENMVVVLGMFCRCRHMAPGEMFDEVREVNMFMVDREVIDMMPYCRYCHERITLTGRVPTQEEVDNSVKVED